jgi:thymidylate kinase
LARAHKGLLISLEGIDGSGKTTLSRKIGAALEGAGATCCSNKEIVEDGSFVQDAMEKIASLLWPKEHTTFDHVLPLEYWLSLQVAWYSLLDRFVVSPRLARGDILIMDGWYHKFMAKLLLRGCRFEYLSTVFEHITRPDLVILLDVDVREVWKRKKDFRPHELGLHHHYGELGESSFVDYQSNIFAQMSFLAGELGWRRIRLDVTAPIEENSQLLVDTINAICIGNGITSGL